METKEAGRLGGLARAAALSPEAKTAHAAKMNTARWTKKDFTNKANRTRKKRLAARKAGRIAAESRRKNR
jgi:hypothetical protein